jgi:hypothetical protein
VSQHEHHDYLTDRFPFAYEDQQDPITGRTDGILRRSLKSKSAPKVFHTQSSTEYWTRSGSLVHTDPRGTRDGQIPLDVRIYAFGGTQHGPSDFPPQAGIGQQPANPGDYRPFLRALLTSLDDWCRGQSTPPESIYPRIDNRTLVHFRHTGFPKIPGVRYPEVIQQPPFLDLGERWQTDGIIDNHPPILGDGYATLVAKCDDQGNELGCLLPPEVAVPLATFTGWNVRAKDVGPENELVGLNGSYLPFPLTKADRQKLGDPRPSIEERYGTLASYLEQIEAECRRLASERFLLGEDVDRIVEREKGRPAPLFEKITASN